MSGQGVTGVRDYFDAWTGVILSDVGHTYQAGTVVDHSGAPYRDTNVFLANRAGIGAGMRVLDAGCGACGPAVDIVEHTGDLTIDAMTISEVQAAAGTVHVRAHGLADRIRVRVGDYHQMPFPDGTFDVVYFLESACYTEDNVALFGEALRVLKPGGALYVKDQFVEEGPLTTAETTALAGMNEMFACNITCLLDEVAEAIADAGFTDVQAGGREFFDHAEYKKAIATFVGEGPLLGADGRPELTSLGQGHQYPGVLEGTPPVFTAEIRAIRPR